jgi:hypothetical protein
MQEHRGDLRKCGATAGLTEWEQSTFMIHDREVMDLIKHTFPSRKMVNTATQHVDKPNTRVWDGLMKFHVMEHVPQFIIMYGAWQHCSPMEHKHNHTRRSFLSSTDHRHTVDRQVLSAPCMSCLQMM